MTDRTITTSYQDDHERLDGLFRRFRELRRTDATNAIGFFNEFKHGLRRHIIWEEEILFPLFETKTGIAHAGPTQVMRMEHRQIEKHLDAIDQKIQANDPGTEEEEQALHLLLGMHNQKEERILYPAIDRSVTDQERGAVFTSMKLTPEDRYQR